MDKEVREVSEVSEVDEIDDLDLEAASDFYDFIHTKEYREQKFKLCMESEPEPDLNF